MTFTGDAPGRLEPPAGITRRELRRAITKTVGDVATKAYVDTTVAAAIAAVPPAPVAFVASRKTTDTSRSSTTTVAVDPALQVSMNAGGRYTVRSVVWFSTSILGGFKWLLDGPAGTIVTSRRTVLPGALALSGIAVEEAYPGAQTLVVAATTKGRIEFEVEILVGGSPGTFGFWWAQGVSDGGATKVCAGSHLEVL